MVQLRYVQPSSGSAAATPPGRGQRPSLTLSPPAPALRFACRAGRRPFQRSIAVVAGHRNESPQIFDVREYNTRSYLRFWAGTALIYNHTPTPRKRNYEITKLQQPHGARGARRARASAGRRATRGPVSPLAHPSTPALGEIRGRDGPGRCRRGPQQTFLHTNSK